MKLWIDDVRYPPTYYPWMAKYLPRFISRWLTPWTWAKTSRAAFDHILDCVRMDEPIEKISFDHDLGGDDTTVEIADYIEELAFEAKIDRIDWYIHSANPVGRKRLQQALENADRYWDSIESK